MESFDGIIFVYTLIVIVMSVVVHEVAHGAVADFLGDKTARLAGRLTLNPISHLDPIGSVFLPALTAFLGAPIFGWAKPVPYNPNNLPRGRAPEIAVALAGVAVNFLLAIVFGLLIRFSGELGLASISFYEIAAMIVLANLSLAIFNLIPIPPLDGSKIFLAFAPSRARNLLDQFEKYGLLVIFLFVFFAASLLHPVITFFFELLTGL